MLGLYAVVFRLNLQKLLRKRLQLQGISREMRVVALLLVNLLITSINRDLLKHQTDKALILQVVQLRQLILEVLPQKANLEHEETNPNHIEKDPFRQVLQLKITNNQHINS